MSRYYRIQATVTPPVPFTETAAFEALDDLDQATRETWFFDTWDTLPDGSFWGSGQNDLSGSEQEMAEILAAAIMTVIPGAVVNIGVTDLDSAPETTFRFGPLTT